MPLIHSATNAARSRNIAELIDSGHPPQQAAAAAYREQRDVKAERAGHQSHAHKHPDTKCAYHDACH